MAKAKSKKTSSKCKCKRGKDGRMHCFKRTTGRRIVGCKRPKQSKK